MSYLTHSLTTRAGIIGHKLRASLACKYALHNGGGNIIIHKRVTLQGINNLDIGQNVQIGQDSFIQATGKVTLGENVMIWTRD